MGPLHTHTHIGHKHSQASTMALFQESRLFDNEHVKQITLQYNG